MIYRIVSNKNDKKSQNEILVLLFPMIILLITSFLQKHFEVDYILDIGFRQKQFQGRFLGHILKSRTLLSIMTLVFFHYISN